MTASLESAQVAFQTSAYSLKALTASLQPLLQAAPDGASVVGLDFDATVAWPVYDWMGVAKAALESIARYLARDMGELGLKACLSAAYDTVHISFPNAAVIGFSVALNLVSLTVHA